jgi:hypothetical protein
MSPRQRTIDPEKGLLLVEWPLFGELSRALALKVARAFDPEVVVGVATAGVVPGAVIAAILDRPFASITVSRRFRAETVRETPAVIGAAPAEVRGRRVLIVDETCGSGDTLRLARSADRQRRARHRAHGGGLPHRARTSRTSTRWPRERDRAAVGPRGARRAASWCRIRSTPGCSERVRAVGL